jgi:hypothetical protein
MDILHGPRVLTQPRAQQAKAQCRGGAMTAKRKALTKRRERFLRIRRLSRSPRRVPLFKYRRPIAVRPATDGA